MQIKFYSILTQYKVKRGIFKQIFKNPENIQIPIIG